MPPAAALGRRSLSTHLGRADGVRSQELQARVRAETAKFVSWCGPMRAAPALLWGRAAVWFTGRAVSMCCAVPCWACRRRQNTAFLLGAGSVLGGGALVTGGAVYVRRNPAIVDRALAWLAQWESSPGPTLSP
jgi:hypothetical protein